MSKIKVIPNIEETLKCMIFKIIEINIIVLVPGVDSFDENEKTMLPLKAVQKSNRVSK